MTEVTERPAVPASEGPRTMALLCLLGVPLGVALLLLLAFSSGAAALAGVVGVADEATAVVTEKQFTPKTFGKGSRCSSYEFRVTWPGGDGTFVVCENQPLTALEVGDEVPIRSVPWADEVSPRESEGDLFWAVTAAVVGPWALVQGLVSARRYRRLARPGHGDRWGGRASTVHRNYLTVSTDQGKLDGGRRLVLLPGSSHPKVAVDDPVEVWSSRRSIVLARPRGPWVVQARGHASLYTHGWWRRSWS